MSERARASKRGGIRRTLATLGVVVLVVVGALVWAVWPYVMAEARGPDHAALARLNALAMEGQPEGENGWEVMREFLRDDCGLTSAREYGNERWLLARAPMTDATELLNNAWDDPRVAAHRAAFEQCRWLLPHLDQAMAHDRYFVPYRWDGDVLTNAADEPTREIDIPMSTFRPIRCLGQWNLVAMREAAITGDWSEVVHRMRTAMRLGERSSRQVLMIEWMIGMSMQGIALLELSRLVNEFDIPSEVCAALHQGIVEEQWPMGRTDLLLEGEAIYSAQFARAMFGTHGVFLTWRYDRMEDAFAFRGGPVDAPPTVLERLSNVRSMGKPSWRDMEEALDAARAESRKALSGEAYQGAAHAFGGPFELPADVRDFVMMSPGSFNGLRRQLDRLAASTSATLLMLELEAWHAREGRWPSSLAEAFGAGGGIEPVSTRPFEYQLLDADDPRPYSLRFPADAPYLETEVASEQFDPYECNPVRRRVKTAAEFERDGHWEMDEVE